MTTNIDLCNRALAMAGTRSQITDLVSSPEGVYCGLLYGEFRDFMLRQGDYDFSLAIAALTGELAVNPPYAYRYNYPPFCVRIRQLIPTTITTFDPQPIAWNLTGTFILTNLQAVEVIFTTDNVPEDDWDSVFTDAFVRLLASGLFFALENRIEAHNVAIKEALEFAQLGAMINP